MLYCVETILCNSIVEEKGDDEHGRNTIPRILLTYHPTNPPRRGGPLCPPVRFGMEMGFIDVNPPLAGWMHRMCADLAGWDENSVWFSVRLRLFVA